MSTFAATVNAAPAYIVNDIYKRYINPNASDRKYVTMSYIVSLTVVVIGISVGFFVESINTVTLWIVSNLWGGYTAANVLKWYWWRFNGFGYFWGMMVGLISSLTMPKLIPMLVARFAPDLLTVADVFYVFPVILFLSIIGSILGCLLTRPDDEEVLKSFYKQVRPWGFWKPIHAKVVADDPTFQGNQDFKRDMLNVVIGIIWQTSMVVIPVYLIIETTASKGLILNARLLWTYSALAAYNQDAVCQALARAGVVRTRDLETWERLPDLKAPGLQHRNYVLHPEFIDGKYGLYTRPTADFKNTGTGSGIGWGLCDSMEQAEINSEVVVDPCVYHTITEGKNGQGPAPIKTKQGWLHLAHGVRDSAAGYRYVLYLFLTDLAEPWRITHRPAGYFMAPQGQERVGDVSNVLFANGWVTRDDGRVLIYYGASDTRLHVAASTVDRLLDYVMHTPPDPVSWYQCLQQRKALIAKNLRLTSAGH